MRDRSRLISIEISDKAKKIYDGQPHKGEFVSDAIVEKHSRDSGTDLSAQVQELRERIERLERKEEEK